MQCRTTVVLGALVIGLAFASHVSAQGIATPFVGANLGGDTPDAPRLTYGGSIGFIGGGIVGVEVDVAHSPDFFPDSVPDNRFRVTGSVTTVMGNLVLAVPIGGMRGIGVQPYASGGVGLIRTNVEALDTLFELTTRHLGINIGGGVIGYVNDHFGVRGDLRYFRDISDPEDNPDFSYDTNDFHFWRATVGAALRF